MSDIARTAREERPIDKLASAYEAIGRKVTCEGDGSYKFECPCRADDHTPSLHVSEGSQCPLVFHCFANENCDYDTIMASLWGLGVDPDYEETARTPVRLGAFPELVVGAVHKPLDVVSLDPSLLTHPKLGEPTQVWVYTDWDGEAEIFLNAKARYDRPNGSKTFLPWRLVSDEGSVKLQAKGYPTPRPLYRLADLRRDPKASVLIVEGEKAAEAAAELLSATLPGWIVTTWQDGTKAVRKADWLPMKGRRVVIWPDNDDPGKDAAENVASACLEAGAEQVLIVTVPEPFSEKWDLANPLPDGFTVDNISELVQDASVHTQAAIASVERHAAVQTTIEDERGYFRLRDLIAHPPPPIRWVIPSLIPEGLTILAGRPKSGKSWLCLHLALEVASGGKVLNRIPVEESAVLYYDIENGQRRIYDRAIPILGEREAPDKLWMNRNLAHLDQGAIEEIGLALDRMPETRLVVIDTLGQIKPRIKSSDRFLDEYEMGAQLQRFAEEQGIALVLIHHTRKPLPTDIEEVTVQIAGTTGITASVDTIAVLKKKRDGTQILHVSGRDVMEQELAIAVDPEKGSWNLLGEVEDRSNTPERREVLSILKQARMPLTPKQIHELRKTDSSEAATRKLLRKMYKDEEIDQPKSGSYTAHNAHNGHTDRLAEIASSTFEKSLEAA